MSARRNTGAKLTLTDSEFVGNSAKNGGGLYCHSCKASQISGTTFEGNTADTGGGIYVQWSQGSLHFTNSSWIGNRASGLGGGVYITNDGNNQTDEHSFTSCVFVGNVATTAAAIELWDSGLAVPMTNCTFAFNAANAGGAVEWRYAKGCRLTNSISAGNHATQSGANAL